MSTNYYFKVEKTTCPTCGTGKDIILHIGKASSKWVFMLRAHPDLGILTLADWEDHCLQHPEGRIEDESGNAVKFSELAEKIQEASGNPRRMSDYSSDWHLGSVGTYDVCHQVFS